MGAEDLIRLDLSRYFISIPLPSLFTDIIPHNSPPRPQWGPVSIHTLQQQLKTYSSDAAALPRCSTSPARPPLPGQL